MTKPNEFKQPPKPYQIALMLLLSVVCIEIFLRILGWGYTFLQKNSNSNFKSGASINILCIGESTTALGLNESYPSQLQTLLDKIYGVEKFHVINEGAPAVSSREVFSALESKLIKYRPNLVITMVGINDLLYCNAPPWWQQFKIVQFSRLFYKNFIHQPDYAEFDPVSNWYTDQLVLNLKTSTDERKASEAFKNKNYYTAERFYNELAPDHNPSEEMLWHLAVLAAERGSRQDVQKFLNAFLEVRHDSNDYLAAAWYYLSHFSDAPEAIEFAFKQLKLAVDANPRNATALNLLGHLYKHNFKNYESAENYYLKSNEISPCMTSNIVSLSDIYEQLGDRSKQLTTLSACLSSNQKDSIKIWENYILTLVDTGQKDEAAKYLELGLKKYPGASVLLNILSKQHPRANQHNGIPLDLAVTKENYNSIAYLLRSFGIKHVAMQYPARDVESLKQLLSDYPEVGLIDNNENFRSALKSHEYAELFTDKFAGDFGHCTKLGNSIIAEQVVSTLQSLNIIPRPPK